MATLPICVIPCTLFLIPSQASAFAIDPTTAARQTARVTPFLLLLALSALLDHAVGWVTAIVLTAGLVRLQARLEMELKKGVCGEFGCCLRLL